MRTSLTMMLRRLGRALTILIAITCLYLFLRSRFVVIIPLIGGSVAAAVDRPLERAPERAPETVPETTNRSRIAKVTIATNVLNSSIIDRALRTHAVQNELHGYTHFISRQELVSDLSEHDAQHRPRGAWSKPAYLLSIIVMELAKPENERLEWIFWFDADTIILNPHIPLEVFLPPANVAELQYIHMLMAKNWDGLNSGVFAFRVHPWSVSILSAVLAYPIYQNGLTKTDRFRDQSAFQWLMEPKKDSPLFSDPYKGKENWAEVPMRWFNSLPMNNAFSKSLDWIFNHNMTEAMFDNGTDKVYNDGNKGGVRPWKVMQGDLAVHFAGANPVRDSWMGPWLNRTEQYLPQWSNASKVPEMEMESRMFWQGQKMRIERGREESRRGKETASKGTQKKSSEKVLLPKPVRITTTTTTTFTGNVKTAGGAAETHTVKTLA